MRLIQLNRRLFLGAASGFFVPSLAFPAQNLAIEIDAKAAPQLDSWAQELARRVQRWWPIINGALASTGYKPPEKITLRFLDSMPEKLAGRTTGSVISLNAPYIIKNPSFYNFVGHELVHVVQAYPQPFSGWLMEGIADYVRYFVLFPLDPERIFNPTLVDYRRGYQPAAALLDWIERSYGIGSVRKINAALRRGEDGEAAIQKLTSSSLPTLWAQVVTSYTDGSPVPKAL